MEESLLEVDMVYWFSALDVYITVVVLWNVIYCTGKVTDNNIPITVII